MEKATRRVREGCASWIITPLMMYSRNTWSSWALTPLWVLQMCLWTNSIITIGILIFEVSGEGYEVDLGWIVSLAFMFICILLTAAEIGLWFVRALHPWTFLGIQIFKTTFWALYFAVGVATTVAQRVIESNIIWTPWMYWQAVGLSLAFVTSVGASVYGAVVMHRYRKAGTYGPVDIEIGRKEEATVIEVPSPS